MTSKKQKMGEETTFKWPLINFEEEFIKNDGASIADIMDEVCTMDDVILSLLGQCCVDGDAYESDNRFGVICPSKDIVCILHDRWEARELLRNLFTLHWKIDLMWSPADFFEKKPRLANSMDDELEVSTWNSRHVALKKRECEMREGVEFPTNVDILHLSATGKPTITAGEEEKYATFFAVVSEPGFLGLANLSLTHSLPVASAVKTSSQLSWPEYEEKASKFESVYHFEIAARNYVMNSGRDRGIGKDALEYQIHKYTTAWLVSAIISLCEEHPRLEQALLHSHRAKLIPDRTSAFRLTLEMQNALQVVRKIVQIKHQGALREKQEKTKTDSAAITEDGNAQ